MNRHWALKLGDLCEIVSGATPKTGVSAYWDGDVPWVTPADLSKLDGAYIADTPRKITTAGLASCSSRLLPANSVLLSSRAPIGHVAINTVPMATNQGFKSLVPKQGLVESKYLYHWLRYHKGQIQALGNGATFKEVSKATVAEIGIDLPPLDEQRRIAAILDRADALRQKRKRAIALLDSLTQSIFLEMFGDPILNPKNLPSTTLGELEEFLTSGSRGWAKYYAPEGRAFIRIQNLRAGILDTSEMAYVDAPDGAETRRTTVKTDDVLISITADLGRVAVVPQALDGNANINQHLALFRPKDIDSTYLAHFLASPGGQRQFAARDKGGVKAGLNFNDIRKVGVLLPPKTEQLKFAAIVRAVAAGSATVSAYSTEEETLFASLQHRAFSGQL